MMRQRQTKCPAGKNRKTARALRRAALVLAMAVLALSFSAYAWFQASVVSSGNTIVAGTYAVDVSVSQLSSGTEEIANAPVNTVKDEAGDSTVTLTAGTGYLVTLTARGTVSTGYCVISDGTDTWYTDQIGTEANANSLSFKVYPDEQNITYTFTAHWGTPDQYDQTQRIENGGSIPRSSTEVTTEELPVQEETLAPDISTPTGDAGTGTDGQTSSGGSLTEEPSDVQQPQEAGSQETPPAGDNTGAESSAPDGGGTSSAPGEENQSGDVPEGTGETSSAPAGTESPAQSAVSSGGDSAPASSAAPVE